MEQPRPEGTPEQEAMKRPLSMLAEVLDDGHIKGISPEVLIKNNVPESRAREIFDYMKKNGAIGEEGSAEEGYAVDRERLQELIEGAPSKSEKEKTPDVQETIETARKEVGQEIKDGQAAAERAGAVDPASRDSLREAGGELGKTVEQEAARVAFVEETARIINEKLVASVNFSPEFEPELRDALFERGPEKIRELLNNLRELLRDTPAELGEFAVEIFGDDHIALSPEKKSLEFGIAALGEKVLSKTAQKLERVTKKIMEDHEALRERERLAHEEEIFNREQKAFEAKVARFAILPILKQAAVEAGSAQKFFRSLESALNLGDAAVAQELKGRQVFVIDGDEVSISPQSITIGIGALRPSVVRETARKVRKKITPPAAAAPQQEPPRVEAPALKPVAPQEQSAPEILPREPEAPADSGIAPNPETPPGGAEIPPSRELPPAESSDEKKGRWETIFQTVVISDQAEKWIASESGPGEEPFTQSVDEFVTLISADPEIVPLLKNYRLYVHSAENSSATKGNIRVSASELMKEGPQAIAYYFNDEIRELEGLAIVPLGRPNQPAGKDDVQGLKKPGERLAEWHMKWEAVFRKVDIATSARIWAESKGSSGVEDLLQSSDELLTLVSADSELLPYLFEYRIFIHGHEGNLLGKGNLSISAPDLLRDGPEATAKLLVAKIRELEGLPPKVVVQEGSAVVPPEVPPTAEKTPKEKLTDLLENWQREGKSIAVMNFLREIVAAPRERWPSLLARAAGMVHRGESLYPYEFEQISDIIGEGVTMEQLADRNRTAAATTPEEIGTRHRADKEYRDPVRTFMRDVMHLSEDEIQAINFQYKVIVGQNAEGGIAVTCSNYHDFLREREKMPSDERTRLDEMAWGTNPYRKVAFLAAAFWNRLQEPGGDLAEYATDFYQLLYGDVHGEFVPDDFAAWAKAEENKSPASAAARPEREKESIYETVDRLNATYTQFDLTLADTTDAERESNVNILRRIEDEIYPTIIPLIERGSRIYLRVSNYSNAFLNSGGRGSQSFASGSTGIEIDKHETNENIIAHIQEFLKHNPQFAVGGRAPDGERTRTELAGEDEEAETMSLDEARDAYRMAYAQYQHRNPRQRGQIYGTSGDTSALETARARYDAALKIAAERIRKNEHDRVLVPGSVWTSEDATNSANRLIFEELVIAEEKRISDLRIEELQEEERSFMKRIWLSYARMPRWKKVALSMTIGAGIAGATGGGMAVLFYAGKKAASFSASAVAGFGTTTAFEAIDLAAGKTGTKEYKLEELIDNRRDDISQNLDDMRQEYKAILEQDADRERKRMYLKAGIAALAGVGAAMELHHLTSVPSPGASTHHEGAPPKAAPERIGPTDRPSPLGNPTESQAPSPGVTQSPAHTEPQTEAPRGERPVVEEQPATIPAARPPVTETEPAAPPAEPPHTFKLPEARHDIQKPVELPEAPEATLPPPTPLSTIFGPQEPQPDIYDLPLTHPGYGVAGAHLPNPLENPVEPVPPDAFHAATETQETLRRLKQMSADMAANPVPRPPILPPMHPPDTIFPPRPPETIPLTAPTEVPHGIVGQTGVVRPELGNAPTPEAVQSSIAVWDGKDIAQAAKIAHQIEDVSRLSLQDRSLLVSSLAQKVGDKNWSVNINHFDADAVSRQVKDYLVAYPEAEHLGFHSYSEYAGVKDLSLQKLTEQMPSNLPSALRHSLFHRGAHIEELRNGRIHNVPLKIEHVQLNNALILTTAPAEQSRTVGELLAERAQDVEYQLPRVLQMMRQSLGLSR